MPDWRAGVDAWIDEQLDRPRVEVAAATSTRPHDRPWSTVFRVPTVEATCFSRRLSTAAHEAALIEFLAVRRPDCIPPLLAVDPSRGWMLMRGRGLKLRELIEAERSLGRWRDVLPLYAGVQIDLVGEVDALLALGVPDFRLACFPIGPRPCSISSTDSSERNGAGHPGGDAAGRGGSATSSPLRPPRDDSARRLHDAQVFVRDDRYLLLDWGDACVSHPFFTMAVTLDGVIAWGVDDVEGSEPTEPYRDAYLEPFRGSHDETDLVGTGADRATARLALSRAQRPVVAPSRRTRARPCGSGCSSTAAMRTA